MSRIRKAYETQFRWALEQVGTRRLDEGVQWLVDRARRLSAARNISFADALRRVWDGLVIRRRFARKSSPVGIHFFCDAGLGGLARWLRAAGYEAEWHEGIDDDVLLREAQKTGATILTTDSMLMERRLLRDRVIPSMWLPPIMRIPEQLALVFREFGLGVHPPRCMACGGELLRAEKEALRERIPPKTYRWLDEYFVCARCGRLFWHGTHWSKIARGLANLKGGGSERNP